MKVQKQEDGSLLLKEENKEDKEYIDFLYYHYDENGQKSFLKTYELERMLCSLESFVKKGIFNSIDKDCCEYNLDYHFPDHEEDAIREDVAHWEKLTVLRLLKERSKIMIRASRMFGKTTILTWYALWRALRIQNTKILFVAINPDAVRNIREMIEGDFNRFQSNTEAPFNLEISGFSLHFSNGSKIDVTCKPSSDEDYDVLVFDDIAFFSEEKLKDIHENIIVPAEDDEDKRIVIMTTPDPKNQYFKTMWKESKEKKIVQSDSFGSSASIYAMRHISYRSCPLLMKRLEEIARETHPTFETEWLANFE